MDIEHDTWFTVANDTDAGAFTDDTKMGVGTGFDFVAVGSHALPNGVELVDLAFVLSTRREQVTAVRMMFPASVMDRVCDEWRKARDYHEMVLQDAMEASA